MAWAMAWTTCSGATPASAASAIVRAGPVRRIPSRTTVSGPASGRGVVCSATPARRGGVRVQRAPGSPGELAAGPRNGQVDQVRDAVRKSEELERGLVRHDGIGREAQPGCEELFARRGGVVA